METLHALRLILASCLVWLTGWLPRSGGAAGVRVFQYLFHIESLPVFVDVYSGTGAHKAFGMAGIVRHPG